MHGFAPIVQVIDDVCSRQEVKGCNKADILSPLTDTIRIMSSLFTKVCQTRRKVIKRDLEPPYTKLCIPDTHPCPKTFCSATEAILAPKAVKIQTSARLY